MKYLVLFLLLWSGIGDFFSSKLSALGYIDELIILSLSIHMIFHAIAYPGEKKRDVEIPFTGLFIILLLGWSFVSLIVNKSSFIQFLLLVFSISKGFIVFYWIKKFGHALFIWSGVLKLIKILIIIQIPFFVVGLLLYRGDYFGDNATGALITGDASAVATFFWVGIIICLGRFEELKNRVYLAFALILLALIIVTSTKQLTILLPLVLFVLYWKKIRFARFKQMAFVGVGLLAAVLLYNAVERKWMMNYGVDASESSLVDYMDESEKILGYYSLIYELPEEVNQPLLWGAGPGMYGTFVAMNARTHLSEKYIMSYVDLVPEGLGGTLAYRSSSVIGFCGDLGLIGLALIFTIYAYQTIFRSRQVNQRGKEALHHLIIACGILLLAQSFILNVFEGNSFALNLFWILCGVSAAGFQHAQSEAEANV